MLHKCIICWQWKERNLRCVGHKTYINLQSVRLNAQFHPTHCNRLLFGTLHSSIHLSAINYRWEPCSVPSNSLQLITVWNSAKFHPPHCNRLQF